MGFTTRYLANLTGPPIATQSLDFERTSAMRLTMPIANFGVYNKSKFAIAFWYKRESTGAAMFLYANGDAGDRGFDISLNASNKFDIVTTSDGSTIDGRLITTATFTDTASWHHFLFWFDVANPTAGDRMRLWHDGTELTAFDTDTNPTVAVFTSTADATIGGRAASTNTFDGLLYVPSLFSNANPLVTDLRTAGGVPLNPIGQTGLYSLLSTNATDALEDDYVIATNWTNVNTVIKSVDIPT